MPDSNASRMERASEYLGVLVEETKQLTERTAGLQVEIRMDRFERRRTRILAAGAAILFAFLIVAMLSLAGLNRQSLNDIRELNKDLNDCTVAGGQCFEESQARQVEAVRQIARDNAQTNVQIVSCAQTNRTAEAFRACVEQKRPDLFPDAR